MAMMSIYIDESYSHRPKPEVYTIAGYVSEDWRWKRFEREWSKTLTSEGLEYFHMVEFAHKKGVYADWPETKRRKFLRTLHYIIHSNTIIDFSVNGVVDKEQLSQVLENAERAVRIMKAETKD
jgi:hypothetical protein